MLKLFSIIRQMPLVFCFRFAHAHCSRNLIVTFKADYLLLRITAIFGATVEKLVNVIAFNLTPPTPSYCVITTFKVAAAFFFRKEM